MKHACNPIKISLISKIIFMLVPIGALVLVEMSARTFLYFTGRKPLQEKNLFTRNISVEEASVADNYEIHKKESMYNFPFHCFDKDLFYRPKPNTIFPFMVPNGSFVKYYINSSGYRGKEFTLKKGNRVVRIICAGDSSTFGYFVNQDDTYSQKLENILSEMKSEKKYEVINAGVIGYSSYQGRTLFEKELRKFAPDILIFSFGINDSLMDHIPDAMKKHEYAAIWQTKKFVNSLALYRLTVESIHKFNRFFESRGKSLRADENFKRVSLEAYRGNIERIASLCREDGITLIILPISVPLPYFEIMKEEAVKQKACLIDIEETFSRSYKKITQDSSIPEASCGHVFERQTDSELFELFGSEDMVRLRKCNNLFMDYCHPTPYGHEIIAEELFNYLKDNGYLKKSNL